MRAQLLKTFIKSWRNLWNKNAGMTWVFHEASLPKLLSELTEDTRQARGEANTYIHVQGKNCHTYSYEHMIIVITVKESWTLQLAGMVFCDE